MKRLLREPLAHFVLLGAALFALYAARQHGGPADRSEIVVSAGQVENLAATFARTWQRPPTADELKGLVDQFVKEEAYSREAVKLGLDRDDPVIRRRLQQKLEFVAEDFAAADDPTETELADYLAKHPDRFLREPVLTFEQLFLDPRKRGDRLAEDADAMLTQRNRRDGGSAGNAPGDPTLLPHELTDQPLHAVASIFGEELASALLEIPTDTWVGPLPSAYGAHLVRLTKRVEGSTPPLAEVRDDVARELTSERRLAAQRKFQEEMLARYRVKIEWPASGADRPPAAAAAR
ncbi:MAG: peptidyl-prolyl cis-trans isomerase [Thermoanaerobaculia bacterium]